jgi:hypothetical protein
MDRLVLSSVNVPAPRVLGSLPMPSLRRSASRRSQKSK